MAVEDLYEEGPRVNSWNLFVGLGTSYPSETIKSHCQSVLTVEYQWSVCIKSLLCNVFETKFIVLTILI